MADAVFDGCPIVLTHPSSLSPSTRILTEPCCSRAFLFEPAILVGCCARPWFTLILGPWAGLSCCCLSPHAAHHPPPRSSCPPTLAVLRIPRCFVLLQPTVHHHQTCCSAFCSSLSICTLLLDVRLRPSSPPLLPACSVCSFFRPLLPQALIRLPHVPYWLKPASCILNRVAHLAWVRNTIAQVSCIKPDKTSKGQAIQRRPAAECRDL